MSQLGRLLIAAMVAAGDMTELYKHSDVPDLLSDDPLDQHLWQVLDAHLLKYGKIPSKGVMEQALGAELPAPQEPVAYYADQMRPQHVRKAIQVAVAEANEFLVKDPQKALDLLNERLGVVRRGGAVSVIDFRTSKDLLLKHLKSKWAGSTSYTLGWKTFDASSGGMMPGDLFGLVGLSGLGKTWLIVSRALHVWQKHKVPTMIVSNEIVKERLLERLGALYSHVASNYLKHGMFPTIGDKNIKELFEKSLDQAAKEEVPLYVVDANLGSSIQEVARLARQLGVRFLADDGVYLHKYEGGQKMVRHERIAAVAEYLKQEIATTMMIPTIGSWAFSPSSIKHLKKGTRPGLEEIAGSVDVGRLASVVLGLFQDEQSPETLKTKEVVVVKGRDGESGTFKIRWDFVRMSFDEVAEAEVAPLEIT